MADHMTGKDRPTSKTKSSFFEAALIRAVRTMAQTALAMLPAGAMIQQIDLWTVIGTAALSGVISVLTSVVTDLPEAPMGGDDA